MKLKRLISFLLLSSVLMTAAACTGGGSGGETTPEGTSENIETTSVTDDDKTDTEGTTEPVEEVKFKVTPENDGIMFVNHEVNGFKSGHKGHALVEYEENKILAFYSNDSGQINFGHNNTGWVEYKRSVDGGLTWSEPMVLQYTKDAYDNKECVMCCEKAIVTDDGKIVLFCYRSEYSDEGYGFVIEPTYITSTDGGETWSEPKILFNETSTVWDALYKDGVIYLLMQRSYVAGTYKTGEKGHFLLKSTDNGETYTLVSSITYDRGVTYSYGSMVFTPEGELIIYIYQYADEYNMRYYKSNDNGETFYKYGLSYCPQRIRNPQVIYHNGLYFLHGRSGDKNPPASNFVIYSSRDGINWDKGQILRVTQDQGWGGCSYYSNSIVIGDRILIQASDAYYKGCTNIKHWWIDFEK